MARLRGVDGVVPAVLADGKRGGPGGGAERRIDMDAVEFIREWHRMCKAYKACGKCPAAKTLCGVSSGTRAEYAEKLVQVVEQWAKTHPRKTRQSEFLRQWPEARMDDDGCVAVCPSVFVKNYRSKSDTCFDVNMDCSECRHKFWGQEVE